MFAKAIVYNPALQTHLTKVGELVNYPISHYQLVNDNRMIDFMDCKDINLINNKVVLSTFKVIGIFRVAERNYNPNVSNKFQGYILNLIRIK